MGRTDKQQQRPKPSSTRVVVKLPLHAGAVRRVSHAEALAIHVDPPRALWHGLRPMLFDSPATVARRASWFLLQGLHERTHHATHGTVKAGIGREICTKKQLEHPPCRQTNQHDRDDTATAAAPPPLKRILIPNDGNKSSDDELGQEEIKSCISCRFRLPCDTFSWLPPRNVSVIIRPYATDRFESSQEERLIHFENQLIRAQSMAGYLSTLGGGFFMCHHWRTAVAMARHQQQMARILCDSGMFIKCLVNQAYNCIYAGRFRSARDLLRYVLVAIEEERPSEAQVLVNMVASANLFRKRVKLFAKQALAASAVDAETSDTIYPSMTRAKRQSKTKDDYGRIRIVNDQSSAEDLIRAFGGRTM